MVRLVRGTRGKLEDILDVSKPFQLIMQTEGKAVYDSCCFGVDSNDKLSDERFMIFYNQTASPGNAVVMQNDGKDLTYTADLSKLPGNIAKLVFTVSIDGAGTMGEMISHKLTVSQNGAVCAEMLIPESDLHNEKAIIDIEIYNKTVWRFSAVANGFNGGLADLLNSYGGSLADDTPKTPAGTTSAPSAVSADKQIADKLMNRISLSKDKINLEKHVINLSKCVADISRKNSIDLGNIRAKVVVVLDYSGSMSRLYYDGTVQETLNKLVPLGLTFDDNGSADIFLFQTDFRRMPQLDLSNYEHYVEDVINASGYRMGGTKYSPVLKAIIDGYRLPKKISWKEDFIPPIVDNGDPTFILFITDGENEDQMSTDSVIINSSGKNVFIQFIGIGQETFRYLMKLDEMTGRVRDNTGFSKMEDLRAAGDSELYTNALEQFSNWLKGLQ